VVLLAAVALRLAGLGHCLDQVPHRPVVASHEHALGAVLAGAGHPDDRAVILNRPEILGCDGD